MNIRGQGNSLILIQSHSDSTISNLFSLAGQMEAKFHVEPPWDKRMKNSSNGPGHMTNIADMLIYGKNLKKIFFSITKRANDLETWNAASGTRILLSLFK